MFHGRWLCLGTVHTALDFNTLGPACNQSGHNEYPAVTSRFHSTKVIDFNGQKFGYDKNPLMTSSFISIFLLIVSGGQWMYFRRVWKTAILRGFE